MLGDPVRRRILELLADGEMTSGAVCAVIQGEFGISQPAVSQHLRVLRDSGFATVRPEGARRLYAVDPDRCGRWTRGSAASALLDPAPGGAGDRAGPGPPERRHPATRSTP